MHLATPLTTAEKVNLNDSNRRPQTCMISIYLAFPGKLGATQALLDEHTISRTWNVGPCSQFCAYL